MIKIYKEEYELDKTITPIVSKNMLSIIEENNNLILEIGFNDFIENLKGALTYIDSKNEEKVNVLLDLKDFNLSIDNVIDTYLLSFYFIKSINIFVKSTKNIDLFIEVLSKLEEIKKIKKEHCSNDSKLLELRLQQFFELFDPVTKKILAKTYKKVSVDINGKRAVVIDCHNFFHRTFHGTPEMRDRQNRPTNVIKGLMVLIKSILLENPDFVIFANEGTRNTNVRKEVFSEYKENRNELPDDLLFQINTCIDLLEKMGFNVLSKKGYEADDIIASCSNLLSSKGCYVKVITTDKDLYQIKAEDNPLISIYDPNKKKYISEEDCIAKFAVGFDKCLLVQALMGDATDNIPGIKGVGPSKAAKLIELYGTLENLFANKDSIPGKLGDTIRAQEKEAYTSLKLVSLYKDLLKEEDIEDMKSPSEPFRKIINELNDFSINL